MKNAVLTLSLALISVAGFAQQNPHQHASPVDGKAHKWPQFENEKWAQAYQHYIALKNALVASASEQVSPHADKLMASLDPLEGVGDLKKWALQVKAAKTLSAQREAFAGLSARMVAHLEKAPLRKGKVFVQFCPMARGGKGATWLACKRQINNPYFGDKMLRCGSVKKTFQ